MRIAKISFAGYSKHPKHMNRTHKIKITIGSIASELPTEYLELKLVSTWHQKGDLLTKFSNALAGPLWGNAMQATALFDQYKISRTSSAGLKTGGTEEIFMIRPLVSTLRVKPFFGCRPTKRVRKENHRRHRTINSQSIVPFMGRPGKNSSSRNTENMYSRIAMFCFIYLTFGEDYVPFWW